MTYKYMENLRRKILDFFRDDDVKVFLFGSRARVAKFSEHSDVDIGIVPGDSFDKKKIILLNEIIEESTIPYKVEIVDFSSVTEEFKRVALKDAIIWK